MALTAVAAFLACLALTTGDVLRYGFPSDDPTAEKGNHWAVLVAGSFTYDNYRHQADVCHAYHVLINNGFSPDRIITFMFDDIAQHPMNKRPGVIINHPDGPDVYEGVKIDYRLYDVTKENFLAVLRGDESAITGNGTGRVLKSGPNDHVFVNFVDHGAQGLLCFPGTDYLYLKTFEDTIMEMYNKGMYKQMVLYIEACESGSMFDTWLGDNINVYATTAANANESSYAVYWDDYLETYLGDVYSVKWMEDSDAENLQVETLHKQYKLVKEETNTSHVQQFGDMNIAKEDLAEFQGGEEFKRPKPQILPKVKYDAVKSEDVPLAILYHRLAKAETAAERTTIQAHIDWHHQVRERVEKLIHGLVELSTSDSTTRDFLLTTRSTLRNHECYQSAIDEFHERCMRVPQNDYALRRLYVLANLCEHGVPTEAMLRNINTMCAGAYRL